MPRYEPVYGAFRFRSGSWRPTATRSFEIQFAFNRGSTLKAPPLSLGQGRTSPGGLSIELLAPAPKGHIVTQCGKPAWLR
jgi:hypothetical protein